VKILGNAMAGGSLSTPGIPAPTTPLHRPGRDALSLHRDAPPRPAVVTVAQPTTRDIRAWAIANGYRIATRGAIPAAVKAAYTNIHRAQDGP
jgi:hypothetical protein